MLKVKKVRENMRKYEKVWESMRWEGYCCQKGSKISRRRKSTSQTFFSYEAQISKNYIYKLIKNCRTNSYPVWPEMWPLFLSKTMTYYKIEFLPFTAAFPRNLISFVFLQIKDHLGEFVMYKKAYWHIENVFHFNTQ